MPPPPPPTARPGAGASSFGRLLTSFMALWTVVVVYLTYKEPAAPNDDLQSAYGNLRTLDAPKRAPGDSVLASWLGGEATRRKGQQPSNDEEEARLEAMANDVPRKASLASQSAVVVASPEDLHFADDLADAGFATAVRLMHEYTRVTILVAADKCPQDQLPGPASSCESALRDVLRAEAASLDDESGRREPHIEWLPGDPVKWDVSRAHADALAVLSFLRTRSYAVAHFLTPRLAAPSIFARHQHYALENTAVLVHASYTSSGWARLARDTTADVDALEVDYLEGAAFAYADGVTAEDHATAREVSDAIAAATPEFPGGARFDGDGSAGGEFGTMTTPQFDTNRRKRLLRVLPSPPSAVATSVGKDELPRGALTIGELVYWASLDTIGGLEIFLDAVDKIVMDDSYNGMKHIVSRDEKLRITFVGMPGEARLGLLHDPSGSAHVPGERLVQAKARRWERFVDVEIKRRATHKQILEYLKGVVTSTFDEEVSAKLRESEESLLEELANVRNGSKAHDLSREEQLALHKSQIANTAAVEQSKLRNKGVYRLAILPAAAGSAGGSRRLRECVTAGVPFVANIETAALVLENGMQLMPPPLGAAATRGGGAGATGSGFFAALRKGGRMPGAHADETVSADLDVTKGVTSALAPNDPALSIFLPEARHLQALLKRIFDRGHVIPHALKLAGPGDMDAHVHLLEEHRKLPLRYPIVTHPVLVEKTRRMLPDATGTPLVSVCLITRNRPQMLVQAVRSLARLTYANVEVVIVENGSDKAFKGDVSAALDTANSLVLGASKKIKVVRSSRLSVTEARNLAASSSEGPLLLFMDDDNAALPHELGVLVRALTATGASAVTCGNFYFDGADAPEPPADATVDVEADAVSRARGGWVPLGNAPAIGVFRDAFGDSNLLITRRAFEQVGAFGAPVARSRDSTGEDWELLARLALRGHHLQAVPASLFWYRRTPGSFSKVTARAEYIERTLRPYAESIQPSLVPALRLARALLPAPGGRTAPTAAAAAAWDGMTALLTQMRRQGMHCSASLEHSRAAMAMANVNLTGYNLVQNSDFTRPDATDTTHGAAWAPFGTGYRLSRDDAFPKSKLDGGEGEPPRAPSRRLLARGSINMGGWMEMEEAWRLRAEKKAVLAATGDNHVYAEGGEGRVTGASQKVGLNQTAAAPLFLAAWSACSDVPSQGPHDVGPDYSLYVDVEHSDGTSAYGYHVPFSRGSHGWQRRSAVLVPLKPVRSLTVYLLFRNLLGTARFDDVVVRPLLALEVCAAANPDGGLLALGPSQPGEEAAFTRDTAVLL